MLPNLVGQIVLLQIVPRFEAARHPEPYICVRQTPSSLTVAGTNGGFGSRLFTFNLGDVQVLGYFVADEVIEAQLKLLNFALKNESLSITPVGYRFLVEAQEALATVFEARLREKAQESRAAEDTRIDRYRGEEDEARAAYFAQFRPPAQDQNCNQAAAPLRGETFAEQAFISRPPSDVEANGCVREEQPVKGERVKVHIVIEHKDPAVVKDLAARVREALKDVVE